MRGNIIRLGPREQQIADLLLQGCDNDEIAKRLKMARRTVKAHFNRLFVRFGISGGIKRVKLATLLYRRQLCSEMNGTEAGYLANENTELSNSLPKDSRIEKSQTPSEPQSTSLRTISEPSTTSSDSGTAWNSRSGMKRGATASTPDLLDAWKRSVFGVEKGRLPRRLVPQ